MTDTQKNNIENNVNAHANFIDIKNMRVSHGKKILLAIDQLVLPSNKLIAIIGANGAGKSTFIHALLGQVAGCKITGDIRCYGQKTNNSIAQGKMAWVGQHEQYSVPLTVLDYVLLGTMPNLAWYQQPPKQSVLNAQAYLAEFELLNLADMRIHTLSGGEKQRLSMVRALMQDTDILLLDEPTNHLDIKHQRKLFAYLHNLVHGQGNDEKTSNQRQSTEKSNKDIQNDDSNKNDKSIIMVLHSLTDAYNYADYVVAVAEGSILAHGTPETVMTTDTLRQMYGVDINIFATDHGMVFV